MKTHIAKSVLLFAIAITFTGCKKEEKEPRKEVDLAFIKDHTLAEGEANSIQGFTDNQVNSGSNKTSLNIIWNLPNGATATLNTEATPKLTVDFGSTGVLCNDGRTRRGKIFVDWTGTYSAENTVITTTTENYFVNNHQHRFRRVTTNIGDNTAGNKNFTVQEWDTVALANNGGTITWQSTRNREWIAGDDTPLNIYDDEYRITGTAEGVSRNGRNYSIVTTIQLIIKMNCRYVFSGIIDLLPEGAESIRIDYGSGCQIGKTARVTLGNFSADVPLR